MIFVASLFAMFYLAKFLTARFKLLMRILLIFPLGVLVALIGTLISLFFRKVISGGPLVQEFDVLHGTISTLTFSFWFIFLGLIFIFYFNIGRKNNGASQPQENIINNAKIGINIPKTQAPTHNQANINPEEISESSIADEHWGAALREFDSGDRKTGLYAKHFALSNGNPDQTKANYLKDRAKEISRESSSSTKKFEFNLGDLDINPFEGTITSHQKNPSIKAFTPPLMINIQPGHFLMGSDKSETQRGADEGPQHEHKIPYHFAISRYAVTFNDWDTFINDAGFTYSPNDNLWGRGNLPVIYVSWDDAQAYIKWLNAKSGIKDNDLHRFRLPTEAEWEYACRANTESPYSTPTGEIDLVWANYYISEHIHSNPNPLKCKNRTTAVGSYPPNSWGLYDMHGNVWEWVEDCYINGYQSTSRNGKPWVSDTKYRVMRGGAWNSQKQSCRSAKREFNSKNNRNLMTGFRIAQTL